MKVNTVSSFDPELLFSQQINGANITQISKDLSSVFLSGSDEIQWLLRSVMFLDLTTLSGDDTSVNVDYLCAKASRPLSSTILDALYEKYDVTPTKIHTAAVCVYPYQVNGAVNYLKRIGASSIPVASVAAGFPSAQYPLNTRLSEIGYAIENGAKEIDIVINRSLAIEGRWKELYREVCEMREECGERAHMKAILGVGELGSYRNVYAASMVCMLAGADFIKTSTGKEAVNATLPVTAVMTRAIADFEEAYDVKVGYKPAGGIKVWSEALAHIAFVRSYLGESWLQPELFRIGASSLLASIESRLFCLLRGRSPYPGELTLI